MSREEEPRKADCPGCHGDFYAKSDIKKGINHQKEARLAFVLREYWCLSDVCGLVAVAHMTTARATTLRNCPGCNIQLLSCWGLRWIIAGPDVQPRTVTCLWHREPRRSAASVLLPLNFIKKHRNMSNTSHHSCNWLPERGSQAVISSEFWLFLLTVDPQFH